MASYNIDESYKEYSTQDIFRTIQCLIKDSTYTTYQKILLIAFTLKYISDENLLNSTISILKDCNWLLNDSQILLPLKEKFSNEEYSDNDKTRIKAFAYSDYLAYEVQFKYYSKECDLPKLYIEIIGREVKSNLNQIVEIIKKCSMNLVLNDVISPITPIEQECEYKKIITAMSNIDYEHGTDFFDRDIFHLSNLKNNIINTNHFQTANDVFAHPRIFTTGLGYKLFELLKDNLVKNDHADYSFIYRMMIKDDLIYPTVGDSEFREWLNNEYMIVIDKTKQYDNCKTIDKINLYSILKDSIKP
ncbi:hypothetical protein [Psychroserpens mesophilus]|uniref:hypothetical protein n=1 Tax=Psychroserpens mesophilus TaxID=325473 RepID=UPI00058D51AA|nr:hypothetical protein [Psychroserpens mesophilus]